MSDGMNGPITASDEVRDTYYGIPPLRAPHWRWLIIVYFFLGGIAGASGTIATLASLFSRDRAVERVARYVSFAALVPCPLLLILDLGRPERFLNMLRIVKLRSPMSLGSWALTIMGTLSALATALQLLADLTDPDSLRGLRRLVGIVTLPFSIFISGYTGVLLAATNVPLWWRAFPLLSPAFVCSAYSTALSSISLGLRIGKPERADTARRLAGAGIVCLDAELITMTATVLRLGKIGKPLTGGRYGAIFWPVTYCGGILLPLILQRSARDADDAPGRRTAAALLALMGGFSLRALLVLAGRESAKRPEDYFAMTRSRS